MTEYECPHCERTADSDKHNHEDEPALYCGCQHGANVTLMIRKGA